MFKGRHNEENGWSLDLIIAGAVLTITLCLPWIIFLGANL